LLRGLGCARTHADLSSWRAPPPPADASLPYGVETGIAHMIEIDRRRTPPRTAARQLTGHPGSYAACSSPRTRGEGLTRETARPKIPRLRLCSRVPAALRHWPHNAMCASAHLPCQRDLQLSTSSCRPKHAKNCKVVAKETASLLSAVINCRLHAASPGASRRCLHHLAP